jgi:cytosine/creatinine deaminase
MRFTAPVDLRVGDPVAAVRGAITATGDAVELGVLDGGFTAPRPRSSGEDRAWVQPAGVSLDATGWMLLPPLADVHAHLDKAFTWSSMGEPEGSLDDAVACWSAHSAALSGERMYANARRQVVAALRAGVTAIRSHANYHDGDDPLRGIRALLALREEFRGLVDIQVVAMHASDRPDGLVRDAIALGVDLVGGAPHLAPDPRAELERTIDLAEEAGLGVDVHTDETLDPAALGILDLARRTREWPADRIRSAGHCVSLAMQPADVLTRILDVVAEARVSIVTNPLTNLYLQGWDHPVATPRAIPPLGAIRAAGIALAAGGDNVQDPFNPLGNADMVDVAAALVLGGHLPPRVAWEVASSGGRSVLGLAPARGIAGDVADGVLVRAGSVAEAIAERAVDRIVLRAGRVVSVRRTVYDSIEPDPTSVRPTLQEARS